MSTCGSRETRTVTKGDQGFAFMEAHFRKAAHDAHDGAFDVEQADDEHRGDEQHGGDQIQQETYRTSFKEAQTQMMMMMMAAPSVSTTMYSVDYEGGDPTLKEPME